MKTRGESLMESLVVIAILLAIYWIAGLIILKFFKKEIRNEKGYLACIIGGFILKRAIISSMGWYEKNFSSIITKYIVQQ